MIIKNKRSVMSKYFIANRILIFASNYIYNNKYTTHRLSFRMQDIQLKCYYSTYQDAIDKLNNLQRIHLQTSQNAGIRKSRITNVIDYCKLLDINIDDIDKLNIIHVTGTKGKGSTCAFTESILRHSGYKTGLYTSPHLIEVRERIKINGKPLSYQKFTEYFHHCHERIIENANNKNNSEAPIYFQFLTCMMFYVFIKENIDVAVLEVGIGGEYDSTNIIRNPIASGITSIGLDHCSILGNTVEEIAWQKAGIIKSNSLAFALDQSISILDVFKKRSLEKNTPLCIVKPFIKEDYLSLGLNGYVQLLNSSLASYLAHYWIYFKNGKLSNEWLINNTILIDGYHYTKPINLNVNFINGLENCKWYGRNQIIKSNNPSIVYYLDGAHTFESVKQFIDWFISLNNNNKTKTALIFNYTGNRDGSNLLKLLMKNIDFDIIAFSKVEAYPTDTINKTNNDTTRIISYDNNDNLNHEYLYKEFLKIKSELKIDKTIECKSFLNIKESIDWVTNGNEPLINANNNYYNKNDEHINILVTGSLYLVGLTLKVLKQNIE